MTEYQENIFSIFGYILDTIKDGALNKKDDIDIEAYERASVIYSPTQRGLTGVCEVRKPKPLSPLCKTLIAKTGHAEAHQCLHLLLHAEEFLHTLRVC